MHSLSFFSCGVKHDSFLPFHPENLTIIRFHAHADGITLLLTLIDIQLCSEAAILKRQKEREERKAKKREVEKAKKAEGEVKKVTAGKIQLTSTERLLASLKRIHKR